MLFLKHSFTDYDCVLAMESSSSPPPASEKEPQSITHTCSDIFTPITTVQNLHFADPPELGNIPLITPADPRHELYLFCYVKEVRKLHPEIDVCPGCKFNALSERYHTECQTRSNLHHLSKALAQPDIHSVAQQFQLTLNKLGHHPADSLEVDFLFKKCQKDWKMLVIRAIVYDHKLALPETI
ncbi:MAG: hypothetical protein ACR2M9_01055 [Cyanophyceae cyanobacterium]